MSHCVFCLNQLEENESLLVEECSVDNISALELLKSHFEFSDVIEGQKSHFSFVFIAFLLILENPR